MELLRPTNLALNKKINKFEKQLSGQKLVGKCDPCTPSFFASTRRHLGKDEKGSLPTSQNATATKPWDDVRFSCQSFQCWIALCTGEKWWKVKSEKWKVLDMWWVMFSVGMWSVRGRYMVGMCLGYGRYIVGIWSVRGRYSVVMWSLFGPYGVGIWSVCGRYAIGMWSWCGRYMVCMWSVYGRHVIDMWSVHGRYVVGMCLVLT